VLVEDLGSAFGTFVGDVNIKGKGKIALAPRTALRIGNTILWVERDATSPLPGTYVTIKCLPAINDSLIHADLPLFSEIYDSNAPLANVEPTVRLPGYAESTRVAVQAISGKNLLRINCLPRFRFERRSLQELAEPATVPLEAWINDERVELRPPIEILLLPTAAWHCADHEFALAGFVMPKSDAVIEVGDRARFELRRLLKGAQGFADALESNDPKVVENTLKALYLCLQERYGITYEFEPRTYARDWQLVRFHHEVLDELQGTCIDLALVFAACLENAYRDPLIIVVEIGRDDIGGTTIQHAVVGCWRSSSRASEAVIRHQTKMRQWLKAREIVVIDSKGFPRTKRFLVVCRSHRVRRRGRRSWKTILWPTPLIL